MSSNSRPREAAQVRRHLELLTPQSCLYEREDASEQDRTGKERALARTVLMCLVGGDQSHRVHRHGSVDLQLGLISCAERPSRQACHEPCPQLGNCDLRQSALTRENRPYFLEMLCKWGSFNLKVVGSSPTGGIEKTLFRCALPSHRLLGIRIRRVERIAVDLSGVPETLLGNLWRRAVAARSGALNDPRAIEVVDRLDYDFTGLARGARLHALRVMTFDDAVRRFLGRHPAGTAVALGEGLETQFWRVDNGQMHWLTVDLPETITLRHQLLPDGPRQSSYAGSALDPGWLDGLDPAAPTLVTAQGLFPYFHRDEVHRLLAQVAEQLPGAALVFDVVTEAMLAMVSKASGRERDLAVALWTWLFSADERAAICAIPGIEELCDLAPPFKPNVASLAVAAMARLPGRLRYSLPHIHVLQARFRAPAAR